MFTGIVTAIGEVRAVEPRGEVRRVSIASGYPAAGIAVGASIACAGICLTVVAVEPAAGGSLFQVDAAPETLGLTTAKSWRPGMRVNLERALKIGDELGGHLVAGHVDGIATLVARDDLGASTRMAFSAPGPLARFIAAKGSVAVDGVSLTVNNVEGDGFDVLLIPHTLQITTLGALRVGDEVNLEVDLMARYAARLLEAR